MKIITYSDLHFEFGAYFKLPHNADADLMILAGDIITLKDLKPLDRFLEGRNKPVLYVTGKVTEKLAIWLRLIFSWLCFVFT